MSLPRDEPEPADALTIELDALEQWAVGNRLLAARLAGADADRSVAAEWRRGTLPPGHLGARVVASVSAGVEPLVAAAATARAGTGRAVDVVADLGAAQVTGTVPGVYGDTVVRVEYSRLSAKHRLRAWTQLLALTAALPETAWTATTIGRGTGDSVRRSVVGPVDPAAARRHLADIVDLRARGMRRPLPLAVKTSATYAEKRAAGMSADNAVERAAQDWLSGTYDRENAEEAHRIVWGERAPITALLAEPPWSDEQGPDWPSEEPTRFGAIARRLWTPLLAAESLETL